MAEDEMKKNIKKVIGIFILIGMFLLWFIPRVMIYGLLASIIGTLIYLILVFLFFLAVFLILGD